MRKRSRISVCVISLALFFLLPLSACSPVQSPSASSASSISSSFSSTSSASASQESSSAESSLPATGEPNQLLFEGIGRSCLETSNRYFVLSFANGQGNDCIISCFNKNSYRLWDYPADDLVMGLEFNHSIHILSNGLIVFSSSGTEGKFLTAIDQSGNIAWKIPLMITDSQCVGITANAYGGLYLFYSYYDASKSITVFAVDENGNLSERMPVSGFERYEDILNVSVQEVIPGNNGEVYLHGACGRSIDVYNSDHLQYIAHFDKDLNLLETFFSEDEQYGSIQTDFDNNRIYFLGQDYAKVMHGGGKTMQGVFYALDLNCNTLTEKIYDDGQPYSAALLANGYTLVSLSSSDNTKLLEQEVYIYNSNWNVVDTFNSEVGWPEFYPTEDGGFLLKGNVLAQGESYSSLFVNSVRAKLDTVVIKYSAGFEIEWQKQYSVADGKSGYDYFVFIDDALNILTE